MTDARIGRASVVAVQEAGASDSRVGRASVVAVQEAAASDSRIGRASIVVVQLEPTTFVYGWSMLPIRKS